MDKFDITYFYGPDGEHAVKEECIRDMAEAGITLATLNFGYEVNKKVIPLLEKYGIRAYVEDAELKNAYWENAEDKVEEIVKRIVSEYEDYPAVIGYDLTDEPGKENFPILSKMVDAFRRYDSERECVINLFPNYASNKQLGTNGYEEYLEEFIKTVKPPFISYDHYHFRGRDARDEIKSDSGISERERLIRIAAEKEDDRGGFFENIAMVREKAKKYNIPAMLIVLLICHGPYRDLTRAEIAWEINMSLAYGMKRISYFTYWLVTHDDFWRWDNAFCDREGNKMGHYYDAQAINKIIKPIGDILFDKESLAVFHIGTGEKGAEEFTSFGAIEKIEGKNAVAGFFEDGYIYLVNYDYKNENSLTLYYEEELSLYCDGEFIPSGKILNVNLMPGEAVLIKTAEKVY